MIYLGIKQVIVRNAIPSSSHLFGLTDFAEKLSRPRSFGRRCLTEMLQNRIRNPEWFWVLKAAGKAVPIAIYNLPLYSHLGYFI